MGHAKGELPGTPVSAWLGWVVAGVCFVGLLIAWGAYENKPTQQITLQTYPVCSDSPDRTITEKETLVRLRMREECWSGWIAMPLAWKKFWFEDVANKGYEIEYQDGVRKYYARNDNTPLPGKVPIFRVRGVGEFAIRPEEPQSGVSGSAVEPARPESVPPDSRAPGDVVRQILQDPRSPRFPKDVVDYTPSRAERRDVEACDPRSERRILGVGSQVVRLQQGCWSEWLVVADAFEWSVADKFELEFPNARRLTRATPGHPFWTTGGMFRLRGNGESTVTVRPRQ